MNIEYRHQADLFEVKIGSHDWTPLLACNNLSPQEGAALCRFVGSQWSRMFGTRDEKIFLPLVFTQPEEEEVTFFPGTFNPLHAGHLSCIELTPSRPLVVVPDISPWKDAARFEKECPWNEILKLVEVLPTDVKIYPGFWGNSKENPTVDWLPKTKWQKRSLTIGADSFLSLLKWKQVEQLLPLISTLYVAPRAETATIMHDQREILEKQYPKLEIIFLAHHDYEHISSTELRSE